MAQLGLTRVFEAYRMSEFSVPTHLPDWIQDHVRRYLESAGADGHMWDSSIRGGPGLVPTLLLVTKGRRSGKLQTLPLIYGEAEGGHVIVASRGGAPSHPAWYLNLVAHPEVWVQIAAERFRVKARTATGAERETLWRRMVDIFPPYEDYRRRTKREIPVVVLQPHGS
jgi:deazaflavin-dependent oxidoreductase (nitroreductase family)